MNLAVLSLRFARATAACRRNPTRAFAAFLLLGAAAGAREPTESMDLATIAQIREEGLNRSQVMEHVSWLTDVYGPRLTGSPAMLQASDWVLRKFGEWGLEHPHRHPFPFGKGWSLVRFSAHLVEPQVQPLIGVVTAWTPGTAGTVVAEVVRVQIDSEADLEKYRGKLAGKIILTQPARPVAMLDGPLVSRMTPAQLAEAETTPIPPAPKGPAPAALALRERMQRQTFFRSEGVVAIFERGTDALLSPVGNDMAEMGQRVDGGTIVAAGAGSRTGDTGSGVPQVTLAVEHYNRMVRVLEKELPVRVELNIETRFHDEDTPNGFNTIAEIPGCDPALKDEVVILGAHLDSHAGGTGATDNAVGSAAVMEAMRILQAIEARPRRTVRAILWGGEEHGLLGSRAYVKEHFADRATMELKPAHARVAAYFNTDNGGGRIRGIWLQGNLAAGPIFRQWFAPVADLGVAAVGPRPVFSTDHIPFDEVGLPGFQFMVDRLEYRSRTHHTNMDVYDRVQRDDLVQHATVLAVFAHLAAMRDEMLPRKALPKPRAAPAAKAGP